MLQKPPARPKLSLKGAGLESNEMQLTSFAVVVGAGLNGARIEPPFAGWFPSFQYGLHAFQ